VKKTNYNNKHFHGHLNRQSYKQTLPQQIPQELLAVCVGLLLGDASLYQTKWQGTYIKFEQSYLNKEYLEYVLHILEKWTFYKSPSPSTRKKGFKQGEISSYYFYTLSHPAFNPLWDMFMIDGKKRYKEGTILNYLNSEGLAHWIITDGSLNIHKEYITLHTENFNKKNNFKCAWS